MSAYPEFIHRPTDARWQSKPQVAAELEHLQLVQTEDARGRILYASGEPWTGSWQSKRLTGDNMHSVRVALHDERRATTKLQSTVVGTVGLPDRWPGPKSVQEQGRSGLEATFDDALSGARPGYAGWFENAGGAVTGQVRLIQAKRGADARTTIDHAWQRAADTALAASGVHEGAVVVLDVRSNRILALASRGRKPTTNVALKAQTPGSVFKIVTLSAALESYRFHLQSAFTCVGHVVHPGVRMQCWTVHGRETLVQAFAQSCDAAFAEVGIAVGRHALQRMAERYGLTQYGLQTKSGAPVIAQTEPGVVFRRVGTDAGLLANTAIGQEDVRISPLAGANLAATLGRGGIAGPAQLVADLERGGEVVRVYDSGRRWRAVSAATAAQVRYAMRLAVTLPTGTAHWLASSLAHPAVKTGTAELPDGRVNAWIVGLAPAESPQIAFCVYIGDTSSGRGHRAAKQITQAVLTSYTQFSARSVIG
ncbi:penicillin-binding transpeptidase domain-containing protein [Alicyclobacillus sp. ALC3]|uniref:penicillin-binding transpeptidase domain-containing protein n=1 Tax=Alicyclobacillus sp. ALC3 TaxID=2796143 RepID=UPI0023784347|nr:penicillin-binding transpeptidase domain-containing protein [Alicyclobacillus sp. ALC3]WDL96310.1 hypothetical protein JC200_18565 [Alicyclobacillus sp. ALC3]